jgi:hypothetical protein
MNRISAACVTYAVDRTSYSCNGYGYAIIINPQIYGVYPMRAIEPAVFPRVLASANETLMSLANSLEHAKFPRSAEQVRNMCTILQDIILVEHLKNPARIEWADVSTPNGPTKLRVYVNPRMDR